eukprot:TRINITY_DN30483_c0_g1_i1.p1 TRINITY_DN30483_c0_g1~~TRINITY_DN30483_c0_g1_i1.p1  ORF type:complete len:660 (-),score=144.47 TRINITY_DN30483_c0_g1_i1:42-1739(-)
MGRLNIQAGSTLEGTILVNGRPQNKSFKCIAAYVQQEDVLMGTSTVRETLMFSARLRLPKSMSLEKKERRVACLMDELNLTSCQNTLIGTAYKRGVSGGEKKRASIGVELVTQPSVLFLDEPTSGLDASNAYSLMKTLKNLAANGRTVVCSVHQPRSNIFNMLDRLILLHSGRIVFQGSAKEVVPFFSQMGYEISPHTNPADFIMDVMTETETRDWTVKPVAGTDTTPDTTNKTEQTDEERDPAFPIPPSEMCTFFRASPLYEKDVNGESEADDTTPNNTQPLDSVTYASSSWLQFLLLSKRAAVNTYRDPLNFWSQFSQFVFMALFSGLLFWQLGTGQDDIQDRTGGLYYVLVNALFIPPFVVAFVFPNERRLFNRERGNGTYRTLPFFMAYTLVSFPSQIFFCLLFSAITYPMMALRSGFVHFIVYFLIVFISCLTAESIGLAVSAAVPKAEVAMLVLTAIFVMFMSVGGFFRANKNLPPYLIPVDRISIMKWSFEGIMINEYRDLKLDCNTDPCLFPDGDAVLEGLDIESELGVDIAILCAMIIFYRLIAFWELKYMKFVTN